VLATQKFGLLAGILTTKFNLLKMKYTLLHMRNQSVPRCKHFPPRL